MKKERGGSSNLKRPLPDDDDDDADADADPPPMAKRPRFPKGKKAKRGGDDAAAPAPAPDLGGDDVFTAKWTDPQLAAKERAERRNRRREEDLFRDQGDLSAAEVYYQDNTTFEDDGIRIEPFNLKEEREEGYFDKDGNFVEYANRNEIKDAWLDSIDADSKFAEKVQQETITEEDSQDLSPEDVGKIKRSIANLLQPGETIIQALKRLKGSSGDNRGKMTEITKRMFDQLTDDAVKLMENGEYDVYYEQRETFVREAEGYERLSRARDGILGSEGTGSFNVRHGEDILSDGMGHGAGQSSIWDMPPSTSEANVSSLQVPPSDEDENLDMFCEDDGNADINMQSTVTAVCSDSTSEEILQQTSVKLIPSQDLDSVEAAAGELESDYVYDSSTGYYYSSSLGYYYDPASQLFCCATSGTWYSFDGNTGSYNAIPSDASTVNCT